MKPKKKRQKFITESDLEDYYQFTIANVKSFMEHKMSKETRAEIDNLKENIQAMKESDIRQEGTLARIVEKLDMFDGAFHELKTLVKTEVDAIRRGYVPHEEMKTYKTSIEKEFDMLIDKLDDLKKNMVNQDQFRSVKNIAYGGAGMVLTAFLAAIINNIM